MYLPLANNLHMKGFRGLLGVLTFASCPRVCLLFAEAVILPLLSLEGADIPHVLKLLNYLIVELFAY
jgi:hypothetical protein